MKKLQTVKLVLSIILLVAVYTSALPVPKLIIPHPASAASFTLYGSFTPGGWGTTSSMITQPGPTLTVQPGDSVSLTLFSADSRTHRFCVDYEGTPDFVCQGSELATDAQSSGLAWSLKPTAVTLTSGATVTSVLTVNASTTGPTGAYQPGGYEAVASQVGPYQAVVTATNGTLTHTATVTVNVTSSNANAPISGYLLDIGAAAIIAAIALIGILWYRGSRRRTKP